MNQLLRLGVYSALLLLAACGGGSGGGGGGSSAGGGASESGQFVDAPVSGLSYGPVAGGESALTDINGTFAFRGQPALSFRLGGVELGTVSAADFITPNNLGDGDAVVATNIARFLLTLDKDGDAGDGIFLSASVRDKAGSLMATPSDFAAPDFDTGALAAFARTANGDDRALISADVARAHLAATQKDIADGHFDNDGGADEDSDGVNDAVDSCHGSPSSATVDENGCESAAAAEGDTDSDGVDNINDNCPSHGNTDQTDTDGDARGDACDWDSDGDGVGDSDEEQRGTNPVKADTDGDHISDGNDNCPLVANTNQKDNDRDDLGDACDDDDDNDGLSDSDEQEAGTDPRDSDSDNDGTLDGADAFPNDPAEDSDTDGDGTGNNADTDDDNDGADDSTDNCPLIANTDQTDTDGDGAGDACDGDDDNDGFSDDEDLCRATPADDGEVIDGCSQSQRPQVFAVSDAAADENSEDGQIVFDVVFDQPAPRDFEIEYHTQDVAADNAATGDRDYVAVTGGSVQVPAGQTRVTIPVALINDAEKEAHEIFELVLDGSDFAAPGGDDVGVGTIYDDESLQGLLRVGASKKVVNPTIQQINGVDEPRLGGSTRTQKFNLGGFGFDTFQNFPNPFDMLGDQLTKAAEQPCLLADQIAYDPATFDASQCLENTWIRALVVEQPDPENPGVSEEVVFLILDAVGAGNVIQKDMRAAVEQATGIPASHIVFGQTHTHAGADLQGLWGGVPQSWIRGVLYPQAVAAVREARAAKSAARLQVRSGPMEEYNNYRRPKQTDPDVDTDIIGTLMQAIDARTGEAIAHLMQFNGHPTSINEDPRIPHPDYPLGVTDWLEAQGGVALYFNGPIADASSSGRRPGCENDPKYDDIASDDYGNQHCKGEGIADKALSFPADRTIEQGLAVRNEEVVLPVTNPLFVAAAALGSFNQYYDFTQASDQLPPEIGAQAQYLPQLAPFATTSVTRITLGDAESGLEIVTLPGESTGTFGDWIRSLAAPGAHTMLLGLTQNSFGYIIPEEEFSYIDPSGDVGFVAPFTGYEENVSLGPLTAPLLRLEGYLPLFGLQETPEAYVPPYLAACESEGPDSRNCLFSMAGFRVDYIQREYAASCREFGGAEVEPFCSLIDPDTPLATHCLEAGLPEGFCAILGATGATPTADLLDAAARGCDLLDPAHCLMPFPSDHFTTTAEPGSIQSQTRGGTGKRVNFNILGMPRNIEGKPIDPTEWNRNDGFSPGQLITTYVPGLASNEDGTIPGAPRITHLSESLDTLNSSVLVLDADTARPHPVWAEIDLNAGFLLPANKTENALSPKRAAVLIRPARNFDEGQRYVVVLRNLPSAQIPGEVLEAQAAFRACRDQLANSVGLSERCAEWDRNVRPVLEKAGIPIDDGLYLAWDFTVASAQNNIARLRHMRDAAFASLGQTEDESGNITQLGDAPEFTVDKITENPEEGIARRVEGTITVPSFVTPADPAPLDQLLINAEALCAQSPDDSFREGCETFFEGVGIADGGSVPPNRLFYNSTDSMLENQGAPSDGQYGDALPDSVGTMTTRFTCQIPEQAGADNPARPGIYGHGLLDGHQAVTYDRVDDFSREHNFLFCGVDLFGFATGDVPNVLSVLLDLSNFPVIPDASQQGLLNYMFLARALRHENGFASHEAFRVDGQPAFDNSEVFYDGNSQGGIIGGPVVALSKDIQRGVLGVVGMNYSTLLRRSVDFDGEFDPADPGLPPYALPLYLSYPDDLDRDIGFSLMQMLWDRSENNGYAHHITDNSALNGPDNQVLLHPAFADHQVTHWSAQVMARTIGVDVADLYQRAPGDGVTFEFGDKFTFFDLRDPDTEFFWDLPLVGRDSGVAYDEPGCLGDCRTGKSAFIEMDEGLTEAPPVGNVPPRGDDFDPHGYPRDTHHGKCQKSHFLHPEGRLIDTRHTRYVRSVADCPPVQNQIDSDGDGTADVADAFPQDPAESSDTDGDGIGDNADTDDDGDGVADASDSCAATPEGATVNSRGCSEGQLAALGVEHASCEFGVIPASGESYQVELTSESGQNISFQVLEPASVDCAGSSQGAHPLVLHGHGFGGARSQSGFDALRSKGYAVISIDQRGFGDSGGSIRVMDPDFEGRDLIRILNWAEENLDYLAWRDETTGEFIERPDDAQSESGGDNLVVGAIGSSYGGGFQLLLHAVDPKDRLDALVPDITWHDLRYSLNPGDVLKTAWDLLLVAGGEVFSYSPGFQNGESPANRGLDPYIKETLAHGAATNEFPRDALEWFRYHSPAYWCGLNGQPTRPYMAMDSPVNNNLSGFQEMPGVNTRDGQPGVDVLLTQGMRDTLFNFNDAWWNYQCLNARGAGNGSDVRLLTHQSGHILPGVASTPGALQFQEPGGSGDCGAIDRSTATVEWFNEKLKGHSPSAALQGTDGSLCLSLSDNDTVLIPDSELLAPKHGASGIAAGSSTYHRMDNLALGSIPNGALAQQLYNAGEEFSVLPLVSVTDANGAILAGIPQASLTVSTPQAVNDEACGFGTVPTIRSGCDSITFVGLGVKRAGTDQWQLIDDQIMPVRGLGEHNGFELVGIAERLNQGDELGLMVYGYHPQYLASFSRDPSIQVVNLQGSIKLPLYAVNSNGGPNFEAPASGSLTRITESDSTCSNLSTGVDPECMATGTAAHMLRTVCDYQWLPGVCDQVAFNDPDYRDADYADTSDTGPLDLKVGAMHEHSGYSDGDPAMRPKDYFRAGSIGHNTADDGVGDTGVKLDFIWSSEHSDNEKLSITTAAVCAPFADPLEDSFDAESPEPFLDWFAAGGASSLPEIFSCANIDQNDHYFKWQATLEQAIAATERDGDAYDGFTALRGFEWTNDFYNHMNVYGSTHIINAKNDGSYASMSRMWDWLQTPVSEGGGADALVAFNHPGGDPALTPFDGSQPHNKLLAAGGGANWNDVAYVPEVDDNVVAMEVRGGDDIEFYVRALTNGWHIGPVDAEDEHQREWATTTEGKTLILTRGRSPRDYYFALKNRRTVAVRGSVVDGEPGASVETPTLLYWANGSDIESGAPLGSIVAQLPTPMAEHQLHIRAGGLPAGARLALVSNTGDGQLHPIPLGEADVAGNASVQYAVEHPAKGQDWYFVVACPAAEANCGGNRNHILVSAPIWFGEAEPTSSGGFAEALSAYGDGLAEAVAALGSGDLAGAIAALQGASGAFVGDTVQIAAQQAGAAAGLAVDEPEEPATGAINPPSPLMAGTARQALRVPVGTPLGGYARPPVGGDYIPVAEEFERFPGENPLAGFQAFVDEFADFLPAQDHDGNPLPTIPDELRAIHSPYATYSPPSRGYYDSLITKAVALYDGSDCVVMVKTDFIGMLDEVVQRVADEAESALADKLPVGCDLHEGLVMSATHTHDGPGALANHSTRYFWLAMDLYQPDLFKRLVRQLAEPVVKAVEGMQPARFGYALGADEVGLNRDRRSSVRDLYSPERVSVQDALRKRIGVLRIDTASGEPLAAVINYAAHGIAFDVENMFFSGDVLGAIEREVEQQFDRPVVAMLIQNTGGDVSPSVDRDPKLQGIERYGKLMAPQVMDIYNSVPAFNPAPDIRAVSQRVILSRDRLGYETDEYPYEWGGAQCNAENVPLCLPAPPPDPVDLADNGVAENGAFVPQDTRLTAFTIGDALFLAQPGEPLVEYGQRLLDEAEQLGFSADNTFIWGYSQDHVGYILPDLEDDWRQGGTEGTTTFWGWKQGGRLLDATRDLMTALRDDSAPPVDEFTVNYELYSDFFDSFPAPQPTPTIPAPIGMVQPADIERFGTTYFTWEGNDPIAELPQVMLEREVEPGIYEAVRRDNGEKIDTQFEVHLDYRLTLGLHLWTATFESPKAWPAGNYRFRVLGRDIDSNTVNYAIDSTPFTVTASDSLMVSDATAVSSGIYEATLAYRPQPDNYRVVDAQVASDVPAPVRNGAVVFDNGADVVTATDPVIETRNGQLVAVYRAEIADLGAGITASGTDIYGNTTPGAGEAGRGSGIVGVFADFFASLGGVIQDFLSGDFEAAGQGFETAMMQLSTGLSEWLGGSDDSVASTLIAATTGDPDAFEEETGEALGLHDDPVSVGQQAVTAERRVEPVILTGAQLEGWSVPAAEGVAEPYPSGVGGDGEDFSEPFELNKRDAHNGQILYPAPGTEATVPTGVPVGEVAAYRYDAQADAFVEIPVQVDERMPYFLANAESDFSFYSGTDPELTYVWDREAWNAYGTGCNAQYRVPTQDPIAGIDNDDEIVFMADDAGSLKPSNSFPADWKAVQLVALRDPLDPAASRYVYLVQKDGGSSFGVDDGYVRYERNADADQWIDRHFFEAHDPEKLGTSNTGYGPNRHGSVCDDGTLLTVRESTDRFPRDGVVVSSDTYRWEATGRWMVRDIRVRHPDDTSPDWASRPDLIDRWKGRAFQQSPDSTVSLVGFEDEQVNWEANSTLLGELAGPVRAIREVWGADSGTNVTKTETFYRDAITYRYRIRVHPIPPDGLYTSWDYNRSAMVPEADESVAAGRYYSVLRPQGVPVDGVNDEFGQIDDLPACEQFYTDVPEEIRNSILDFLERADSFPIPFFGAPDGDELERCKAFFDGPDPTFNLVLGFENWEQVSGKGDSGSLVYIFELKNAQALGNPLIVPYYRDDACLDDGTGDDPVPRPWPGEPSDDSRVLSGYEEANGGTPYDQLRCNQRQGAHGAHGVHYFFTHDSDNAFTPLPTTEIDGQQWQFLVPTAEPENVAEPYANTVRARLVPVAAPLTPPSQ